MSTLIGLILLGIYGYGGFRFWNGFERTNFNRNLSNRLTLSVLWLFLLWNKSYRKNYTKALKG
ncbi:MAG TPA: hypothetical protein V6D12_09635 [Candidatus Obscuribacterales bacterium]